MYFVVITENVKIFPIALHTMNLWRQNRTQTPSSFLFWEWHNVFSASINTIDLLEFDNSTQLPLSNGLYSDIEMQENMQPLLEKQMQTV